MPSTARQTNGVDVSSRSNAIVGGSLPGRLSIRQLREQAPQELGFGGNAVGTSRMDTPGSLNHFSVVGHIAIVSQNYNATIWTCGRNSLDLSWSHT